MNVSDAIGDCYLANLWVWLPAAVAIATLAESLYSGIYEHAWISAFFASGLAVGDYFLLGGRRP